MTQTTDDDNQRIHHHRGSVPAGWVKLATYRTATEAGLSAAILAGEGIQSQIFGANVNEVVLPVFSDVDLLVGEADAHRALEVLSRTSDDDLEPAQEPPGAAPPTDEQGRLLVPVAAFDNIKALRDAQTVLASERIDAHAPRLVPRDNRPAPLGKRFILRVAQNDLIAARSLLAAEAEEDRDEPRCPQCGSWRVTERTSFLASLEDLVSPGRPREIECDACHHRGPATEFLQRGDG